MSEKWYKDGLKFKCTQCGKCCTGSPGHVWLTKEDIEKLCLHLNLSEKEFLKKYTRLIGNQYSLTESPKNFDCVFFKDNKCSVYHSRPKQCRVFPFWDSVLESKSAWEGMKGICEGIDHPEGRLYQIGNDPSTDQE